MFKWVFLVFCLPSLEAQSRKDVEVSSRYNSSRELYEITVTNNTISPKTVVVDFTRLSGLYPNMTLPAIIEVSPKSSKKPLSLKKSGIGRMDYSYRTISYTGCLQPEVDFEVIYALPFRDGYETIVYELSSLKKFTKGEEDPEYFNAFALLMEVGDTIFATRKGLVEKIEDGVSDRSQDVTFSRDINFALVRHEDCTIGRYANFEQGQVFVQPGDKINVGDPIGIVNSVPYNGKIQVRLSFYYRNLSDVIKQNVENDAIYFPVKFQTYEGIVEEWDTKTVYTAKIDEELITQEMSKREIKKRRKSEE
jgi:hypothetical protein